MSFTSFTSYITLHKIICFLSIYKMNTQMQTVLVSKADRTFKTILSILSFYNLSRNKIIIKRKICIKGAKLYPPLFSMLCPCYPVLFSSRAFLPPSDILYIYVFIICLLSPTRMNVSLMKAKICLLCFKAIFPVLRTFLGTHYTFNKYLLNPSSRFINNVLISSSSIHRALVLH